MTLEQYLVDIQLCILKNTQSEFPFAEFLSNNVIPLGGQIWHPEISMAYFGYRFILILHILCKETFKDNEI